VSARAANRTMCADCGGELRRTANGRFLERRCDECTYKGRVARWGKAEADKSLRGTMAMRKVWEKRKATETFRSAEERKWREQVSRMTKLAVSLGFLAPLDGQRCADCGKAAQCYDHRDYSQPLLVAAVCLQCNASRRKGLMPTRITPATNDPEAGHG
jgi:hypothetical protein